MRTASGFRRLDTWQLAMTLVERIYQVTTKFPSEERYGLTSQVRRAAVSIPFNVAEGFCRRKTKPYAQHVGIALGSQGELETCLELAVRRKFLAPADYAQLEAMLTSVGSLLSGLHRSLEDKIAREKADRSVKRQGKRDSQPPAPSPDSERSVSRRDFLRRTTRWRVFRRGGACTRGTSIRRRR